MHDAKGDRYLDAYNNVPHVGHSNERVRLAVSQALSSVNVNSRYITRMPIDYAERLLALFPKQLDRMFFVNSGSEANELALRIARQKTGNRGIIVSDFSYHGNTTALAEMTTGLTVHETLGSHVRAITIPDLGTCVEAKDQRDLTAHALESVDQAIASLQSEGYGVAAVIIDPIFSTEGMPTPGQEFISGLVDRVHKAGGMYIADEVQSGFGRTGLHMWGFQHFHRLPDIVTLGKPMGNGLPIGAVIAEGEIINHFAAENQYFNTFATTPASCSAAMAVLDEMEDKTLMGNAAVVGAYLKHRLESLRTHHDEIHSIRGSGLYIGIELSYEGEALGKYAADIVEGMKSLKVLHSRIGRYDNILKIRPPLVFSQEHADMFCTNLDIALHQGRCQ